MSSYRIDHGAVVVPARSAALLSRLLDLDRHRVRWRGQDAELDAVLLAWRETVLAFTNRTLDPPGFRPGFSDETERASTQKPGPHSPPDPQVPRRLGTTEAANLLDLTPQAVTKAARTGRLDGHYHQGRWTFTAEAVALYKTRRTFT